MAKSKSHQTTGSRSSKRPKKKVGKGKKNGSSNSSRAKYVDLESKARKWAQAAHPNVVMHVRRLLHCNRTSNPVFEAPFGPGLRDLLSGLGAISTSAKNRNPLHTSFLFEVMIQWGRIRGAWCNLVYSDGLVHGKLWARKHATAKELSLVKLRLSTDGWWDGVDNWEDVDPAWTPAHSFLCTVRNKVAPEDAEMYGQPPLEHGEFEKFWQRFTSADLKDARCNLYHPKYIEGFVDGALDLSEELRTKFSGTDVTVAQTKTARKRSKAGR